MHYAVQRAHFNAAANTGKIIKLSMNFWLDDRVVSDDGILVLHSMAIMLHKIYIFRKCCATFSSFSLSSSG